MGIYDRDWYKEEAKKRFQVSPSLKARRENKIRSAFEQYTNSVPQATGNRTGRNSLLTYALVWLGLGALCFSLFTWINTPKVSATKSQVEVVIPRAQDGHHYIDGVLNGKRIRFLIDTGASYVSIGGDMAAQLGLLSGIPTKFTTANGAVTGQLFEDQSINVAGMEIPPLTVGVIPNSPNVALLGQNFLRYVELHQVGNKLILRGRNTGLTALSSMNTIVKSSMFGGVVLLLLAWLSTLVLKGSRGRY